MSTSIHPTAIVESGAQLGEGVVVGPYAVIGPNVRLGDRTRVSAHAVLDGYTTFGPDNTVFPFASVGLPPQDLKFRGEKTYLEIGAKNTIREYVTLNPGTSSGRTKTIIGNGNLFMANSHVAHDCIIGNDNILANSVALAGHVVVGNRVTLGGLTAVHQFCRIGDFAFFGGGTMVDLDVPPYCMGQGDRCELRGLNLIGLKRGGFTDDEIRDVKQAYRHLFGRLGSMEKKLESFPAALAENPRVRLMIEFARSTERGICRPHRTGHARNSESA